MPEKRKRRMWSELHVKRLKKFAFQKIPASFMATRLGRTENAIRIKAFELGVSLETRSGAAA